MKTLLLLAALAAAPTLNAALQGIDPPIPNTIAGLKYELQKAKIEMTIAALEEGLAAVEWSGPILNLQLEEFGNDPKLKAKILSNIKTAAESESHIELTIAMLKLELADLQAPPSK
jgi:hypothetical protein